ncbi:hypothetical protein TIFTF001_028811 [Ficus carica]|uniref:Uncharacterized protein n=1 Tax=Ficus carica TaxID=3494 RepID=A0AA88DQR2_FICCA|nr:hypothetical protein TIFTF001_028811 [Ficus carica]
MKLLFSKTLSKTDEKQKLSIPCKKLKNFPFFKGKRTTDFTAKDITNGNRYVFQISVRHKGSYFKPVLSKATWQAYARAKALKAGNFVSFFVDQSDETVYVRACTHHKDEACRKKIRLFGEDMHAWTECIRLPSFS